VNGVKAPADMSAANFIVGFMGTIAFIANTVVGFRGVGVLL
jgi:hypothetical protein